MGIAPDGKPFWTYPSIVGMLLYLTTNTRPKIASDVSQVARFTHNPKQSHATAVKIIIRYLKGAFVKCTIGTMDSKLELTVFAMLTLLASFTGILTVNCYLPKQELYTSSNFQAVP